MVSDPGDWLGQGQTYVFTPANGTFTSAAYPAYYAAWIFFQEGPTGSPRWDFFFAAPNGVPLTVGSYPNAIRFPYPYLATPGSAGFDVSGDGRGCNNVVGSFQVLQVEYAPDGSAGKFWATFEQHCEGATPALRGEVKFNADVPPPVPLLSGVGLATLAAVLLVCGALILLRRFR